MLSLGQNMHIRIAAINEKVSLLPQISMHVRRLALTQFSNKVDTRVICDCAQQGYSIIGP